MTRLLGGHRLGRLLARFGWAGAVLGVLAGRTQCTGTTWSSTGAKVAQNTGLAGRALWGRNAGHAVVALGSRGSRWALGTWVALGAGRTAGVLDGVLARTTGFANDTSCRLVQ